MPIVDATSAQQGKRVAEAGSSLSLLMPPLPPQPSKSSPPTLLLPLQSPLCFSAEAGTGAGAGAGAGAAVGIVFRADIGAGRGPEPGLRAGTGVAGSGAGRTPTFFFSATCFANSLSKCFCSRLLRAAIFPTAGMPLAASADRIWL